MHDGLRFNGAAPARARNGRLPGISVAAAWLLQRGRARAGAECRAGACYLESGADRFNGAAPARARNGADSVHAFHDGVRFNGAAPARARNADTTLTTFFVPDSASTGPRPRGRGMSI